MSHARSNPPEPEPLAFGPVAAYYDALMAQVPYQAWMEYLERLWTWHHLAPRTVLDLACGTGTVSRLLAQRAYDVVGVDLSAPMLAVARDRAAAAGMTIPFFQQDAADLSLEAMRFDAACCLFDSLNYILEPARLWSAFARVFSHLHSGGAFIFDLNTEYALAEGMFNQSCTRRDEALHYRWRSRYDTQSRICTVHMRFSFDPGNGERQAFTEVHRQRGYSKDEILGGLHEAGFRDIFIYDAYSLYPPRKRSDRLFYMAMKPHENSPAE